MPLPSPNKDESQDKFISRCMANPQTNKDFPDQKQRSGVCFSVFRQSKKESIFSKVNGFETKTLDSGDLIRGGYIATTHLDSGFYDEHRELWVKDKIALETLETWMDEINDGNPRANKMSVNHNREPHVSGVMIKGTARIDLLPGGQNGLYVDTLVDKTKDTFNDTEYRMDKGLLDSFSIEFTTRDASTYEYIEGAVSEIQDGNMITRTLLPKTILEGATYASQPMNENSVMIKEIKTFKKQTEGFNMETKDNPTDVPGEGKETKEQKEAKEKAEQEAKLEAEKKEKELKEQVDKLKLELKENAISDRDAALLIKYKEKETLEVKEKEYGDMRDNIMKELKEKMDLTEIKNKPLASKDSDLRETKELKEFNEVLEMENKESKDGSLNFDISIDEQIKRAGALADKLGLTVGGVKMDSKPAEAREYKNFATNGRFLEYKGLGITTNQNSDTDYLLSAAELSDVFDPLIFNILNQSTVAWNVLRKVDKSNKGNNQVQFTLKIAANTTASAYTGNAVALGNVGRQKYMTKFKKYQVGVEVDGDMIAAARGGPIGDVFAQEVSDSTEDLMAVINDAIFAEVGLETAAGIIGFEYITDQAGNTELYNLTRSQANGLSSTTVGDNYINGSAADISLTNLRAAKRKAVGVEGANLNNMVFFTSFIQGDKLRGIFDSAQRLVPTSSRFGFEGRPEFDGIPIFEDRSCNDDDWFLVDLETHQIAIWVPPTLEMLGKDSDSQKGFVKSYFATFNRAPRRMIQIYNNATS